ncbi:hypothetical protein D3C84_911520 [compost metagenome]
MLARVDQQAQAEPHQVGGAQNLHHKRSPGERSKDNAQTCNGTAGPEQVDQDDTPHQGQGLRPCSRHRLMNHGDEIWPGDNDAGQVDQENRQNGRAIDHGLPRE